MADENVSTTQSTQNDAQDNTTSQATENTSTTNNVSQNESGESTKDSSSTDIERLIQKAVDRATNKLGNDNKKLREELAALKKQNLSEAELKDLELKEKEADIADRESKLKDKENRLIAIKAIKDVGLDDGSSNALELVEFVMSDSEEVTKAKVKTLDTLIKKIVAAEVNRTFKQNGRNPEKGGNGSSENKSNIAAKLGKTTADRNAAANKVLNHYIGGKK